MSELDGDRLTALLGPEGPLAKEFNRFEVRASQIEMLRLICRAYTEEQTALIEAGTGTGKSVAYLLPAMLFALEHGERTLISTHTIALQEQLLEKDIPALTEALGLPIKAVLVKGMHNYLCLRKLQDSADEKRFLEFHELSQLEKIEEWAEKTRDGSKSSLPFAPSRGAWERVAAEGESCTHARCPHYQNCFFYKARKEAADAGLIIANHHLFFADLSARSDSSNYQEAAVLPPYRRVVLDEAHHIEDVATEYFAAHVSRIGMLAQLGRLASDRGMGKLKMLHKKILDALPSSPLLTTLELDLLAQKNLVAGHIDETFEALAQVGRGSEEKLRIRQYHIDAPLWQESVKPATKKLLDEGGRLIQMIEGLAQAIDGEEILAERCRGAIADVGGVCLQLAAQLEKLKTFVFANEEPSEVRWIEGALPHLHLYTAKLEIAELLKKALFEPLATTILTSATLASGANFAFVRERLGIEKALEAIYSSPFDFERQSLLSVPIELPDPSHPDYFEVATEMIWEVAQASRGNAFVLFTSYQMLRAAREKLAPRFAEKRYPLLCQGDENRHALLSRFRETNFSVLFGTDSFWEGVDVAGEALRCVVIAKLPFKVPSEPLFQARSELIASRGGSAFFDYSLPLAVVKFKQGFGRLIRNRSDRGCVICLDPRLAKKSYGKVFLQSLPDCPKHFESNTAAIERLKEFYGSS